MSIKVNLALVLVAVCGTVWAQGGNDLEQKMLNDCQVLAK